MLKNTLLGLNASLSNFPLIFKRGGGCIMAWVCRIKGNEMELSTGKILQ
jgi:hypothetical protein